MKKTVAIIENNILSTNTIRQKLTRTLIKEGYQVYILTSGTEEELLQAKNSGLNVIDIKNCNNPADMLKYAANIRRALKKVKPDVCLTFTVRPAIWGNIVTAALKIPTITNITGIGQLFTNNNVVYRSVRTLYKFVLKKTAKVFFQNDDDMQAFLDNNFVSPDRAARIPGSGIDHEYYKPIKSTVPKNGFSFLFISRLIKDKGINEYVEAARLLKDVLPGTEFRVLGPLWLQSLKENTVTQEEVDKWVDEKIINYLGAADDVRPYIAEADCIVLPSYREGMSNVLLEASSMERACITTNTTGCKEIVEEGVTGFLCEVKSGKDLAEKMKKMTMLPAEKRIEMGINARKKVVREFDKQIVIDSYLKAIEEL